MTEQIDRGVVPLAAGDPCRVEPGNALDTAMVPMLWRNRGRLLLLLDAVTVFSAFMLAYYLRFYVEFLTIKSVAIDSVGNYFKGAAMLAAVWCYLIWRDGGYDGGFRGGSVLLQMKSLCLNGVYSLGALMAVSFMYRTLLLSRQVYLMTGVMAACIMILSRLLFQALEKDLAGQGVITQRILIAGVDEQSVGFAERLAQLAATSSVIGFLVANGDREPATGVNVLGCLDEIEKIYSHSPFDKVILSNEIAASANSPESAARLIDLLNFCEANGLQLHTLANVMNVVVTQSEVGSFAGVPVVKMCDAALRPGYAVIKRIMDVTIASLLLVAGTPIWLFIAGAIKWQDGGPVLFSQVRAGLHGQLFRMYKFRSMVMDAEMRLKELVDFDKLSVPGFKLKGDPRVTWIGKWLRRTSLDEIPQLLNVLKGEMSLIGPRPELPGLVERYNPWQRRRLKAKPGITGYQQIMARGQPLAAVIEYDLIYLKHQSLSLDLYILLKTVLVVLRGSGVTH